MIDFLRGWVFNIVTLVLFIVILEILLPSGKMKKFINFVSGFILIIAIMNPFLGLMNKGFDLKEFQFADSNYLDKKEISQNSRYMEEKQMQQIVELYRKKLISRLEDGLKGTGGMESIKADVLIDEDYDAKTFGEIKRIYLILTDKSGSSDIKPVSKVEKIQIGDVKKMKENDDKTQESEVRKDVRNQLEEKVNRLLDVKPEKIVITMQKR